MSDGCAPAINALNRPFWQAAAAGTLLLPFCVASRRHFWPPSPISPFGGDGAVEWREAEPTGRLRSRITYRRAFQKLFEPVMPYGVGLVELEAGPRLLAYLPDPDAAGSPQVDDAVTLVFAPILEGGASVPTIRPID